MMYAYADPEGVGRAEKSQKYIGFLSNTGLDSLKNHKATKPVFNVGPSSCPKSNDGPLLVVQLPAGKGLTYSL